MAEAGKEAKAGSGPRQSQADRRARSRGALLEAAARGLSKYGYANLALAQVASEAGYTRGALYHLFANKEELALAVVRWVEETWQAEVGQLGADETEPVEALLAIARRHAVFCRQEVARVMLVLRVEFAEREDHPVGRALTEAVGRVTVECADLIAAGRASGSIPAGPPPTETAQAYLATLEALGIELAGRAPFDVELTERATRGVLGLPPATATATGAATATEESAVAAVGDLLQP
ncbi:TetR/AcrR family transcriptional regulator [Streptomyces apocyni]|uniref:TetR/AcrR family transcriptional regulator n=1 Tax=Streptomyces apocyni TaxID=2654677 RepID=UPI0012E9FDA1|nr:TetR/AcrR family transcriptional regulator [Streptomyces apocyni]